MLISTALLFDSNIRNSVPMYSGKIAVPPGGGGIRSNEKHMSQFKIRKLNITPLKLLL
jgi:hypothetical protein